MLSGIASVLRIGDVYEARNEYEQAITLYTQSLQVSRILGNRRIETATLLRIGKAQGLLKKYDEALMHLNAALELSRALRETAQEMEILIIMARLEAEQGNVESAQARIEAALGMVEMARRGIQLNDLRASYLASQRELAEFGTDLLMKLRMSKSGEEYTARALLVSERFRARSLLDLLAEARAEIKDDANPELLEQERSLRQKIADKSEALTAI